MNVLAIDIGGTHAKILATGQKERREFESGSTLTPAMMVAGVQKLAGDWRYDAVSIGYPGPVLAIGPSPNHTTSPRVGSGLTSKPRSRVPSRSSTMPRCRRLGATRAARCSSSGWARVLAPR